MSTPLSRRTVLAAACTAGCLTAAGCSSTQPRQDESAPAEITASEVPVGGGIVLADTQLVITQPEAGVFRAFSAVCTHQGCTVSEVTDGFIGCRCHGSRFSIVDGSVIRSPAPEPLPARTVTRTGGVLTVNRSEQITDRDRRVFVRSGE